VADWAICYTEVSSALLCIIVMSYDIKMSQLPKVERSQQKKLNRLIERIEQQKQELATWQNAQADIQNYTRSKLLPVYTELHTVLFEQLDTLWNHLANDAFSKADLAQIDTKIAALAKMLKNLRC
jgi:Iap family predicted aminopeptidase